MDRGGGGSMVQQQRQSNKRSFSEMATQYHAAAERPTFGGHNDNDASTGQQRQTTGLALPPQRYHGDGYDLRTPVTSGGFTDIIDLTEDDQDLSQTSNTRSDLPQSRHPSESASHRSRLPRFGRNIIDLDSEDDSSDGTSHNVNLNSSQAAHPSHLTFEPEPPHRAPSESSQLRRTHRRPTPAPDRDVDMDDVVEVSSRPLRGLERREQTLAELADLRARRNGAYPFAHQIDLTAEDEEEDVIEVDSRPRNNLQGVNTQAPRNAGFGTRTADNNQGNAFGIPHLANLVRREGTLLDHIARRINEYNSYIPQFTAAARQVPNAHRRLPPPVRPASAFPRAFDLPDFDYDEVGFALGLADEDIVPPARHRPNTPPYQAPANPGKGFTRSPEENEEVVCPNCGDELAVGEAETKQQVFVLKSCGHAYCGTCAQNRHAPSKSQSKKGKARAICDAVPPLKRCVVEGCGKTVNSKSLIQVYIS